MGKNLVAAIFFLASPAWAAFEFNGEAVTPTFMIRFGIGTFSKGIGKAVTRSEARGWYGIQPGSSHSLAIPCVGCGTRTVQAGSVFIGDSITQLWNQSAFFGVPVVNKGIGGQMTTQVAARFQTDALGSHPPAVFLLAGINDAIAGVAPTQIASNLASMVAMANKADTKIYVGELLPSVHPTNNGHDIGIDVKAVNSLIKGGIGGSYTVVHYNSALSRCTHAFNQKLFSDTTHPNMMGYKMMSQAVNRAVNGGGKCHHHCALKK